MISAIQQISVIFSGKETVERMRRFDRILGILLFLRSKQAVSASEKDERRVEADVGVLYQIISIPLTDMRYNPLTMAVSVHS